MGVDTLQVDLGERGNPSCRHGHVNARPNRIEELAAETIAAVVAARSRGVRVIDRCSLAVAEEPGQDGQAEFPAALGVEVVASMPCSLEDKVDRRRGKGSFDASIRGLQRLNALGNGQPGSGLAPNPVCKPQGASLPPLPLALQADPQVLGSVTPRWPWYLPPRSL